MPLVTRQLHKELFVGHVVGMQLVAELDRFGGVDWHAAATTTRESQAAPRACSQIISSRSQPRVIAPPCGVDAGSCAPLVRFGAELPRV